MNYCQKINNSPLEFQKKFDEKIAHIELVSSQYKLSIQPDTEKKENNAEKG